MNQFLEHQAQQLLICIVANIKLIVSPFSYYNANIFLFVFGFIEEWHIAFVCFQMICLVHLQFFVKLTWLMFEAMIGLAADMKQNIIE